MQARQEAFVKKLHADFPSLTINGAMNLPNLMAATDSEGNTILHLAAKNAYFSTVQYLLEYGADPLLKNKQGKTPRDLVPFNIPGGSGLYCQSKSCGTVDLAKPSTSCIQLKNLLELYEKITEEKAKQGILETPGTRRTFRSHM